MEHPDLPKALDSPKTLGSPDAVDPPDATARAGRDHAPPALDPGAAMDLLDRFAILSARLRGGLVLLCCDADAGLLQPVAVDDVPVECDDLEKLHTVWQLGRMASGFGATALAMAVCRRGPASLDEHDLGWARALVATCEDHDLACLGCAVAVPGDIRQVPGVP